MNSVFLLVVYYLSYEFKYLATKGKNETMQVNLLVLIFCIDMFSIL